MRGRRELSASEVLDRALVAAQSVLQDVRDLENANAELEERVVQLTDELDETRARAR